MSEEERRVTDDGNASDQDSITSAFYISDETAGSEDVLMVYIISSPNTFVEPDKTYN